METVQGFGSTGRALAPIRSRKPPVPYHRRPLENLPSPKAAVPKEAARARPLVYDVPVPLTAINARARCNPCRTRPLADAVPTCQNRGLYVPTVATLDSGLPAHRGCDARRGIQFLRSRVADK